MKQRSSKLSDINDFLHIPSRKGRRMAAILLFFCIALTSCTAKTDVSSSANTVSTSSYAASQGSTDISSAETNAYASSQFFQPFVSSLYDGVGYIASKQNPDYPEDYPFYPTLEAFFTHYGLEYKSPFYTYDHTKSPFYGNDLYNTPEKIELYYTENAPKGCVVIYDEFGVTRAFITSIKSVQGEKEPPFFNPFADPFDLSAYDDIKGDKENLEKRNDGKPLKFYMTGDLNESDDQSEDYIYGYEFTYDSNGKLQKKSYSHNYMLCSTDCTRTGYFDDAERMTYEHSYITHGNLEYYTIYAGSSKTPSYRLELDYDIGWLVTRTLIKYE